MADQSLKSKVIRNIVRLLLCIDPPNIVEAEKLMEEEHCLELSQGTASRSTILFKMKISLLRGLPDEALRLTKFLLSEDQPIQRFEADIEMISSLLEMDLKKQLPDVGLAGKLNMWSGLVFLAQSCHRTIASTNNKSGLFRELKFSSTSFCADGLRFLIFQHLSSIFNALGQSKATSQDAQTYTSQYCSSFDTFLQSLADLPMVHIMGPNPSGVKNLKAIAYQSIYFPTHLQSNPHKLEAKLIAALQIKGLELLAYIFTSPALNSTPDLTLLCAIKISLDVLFLLISPKASNSVQISQAALPQSDQHSFIQALIKLMSIAQENFGKIPESHPKFFSALPEVVATLTRTSTVVLDAPFLQLAGSITHSCLQQFLNSTAGIEKKHVSICCKSFCKLLGVSMSSDSFGVRGCSLLLMQIVLRTCSQSGPNHASSLSTLQSAISGLHHVLLAEDVTIAAYKEGSGSRSIIILIFFQIPHLSSAARLLSAIDAASRGAHAKFFTCTAYNDAVLLCNTQELVAAERILAVAMTLSKHLSPEENGIAKRVEQACAFSSLFTYLAVVRCADANIFVQILLL